MVIAVLAACALLCWPNSPVRVAGHAAEATRRRSGSGVQAPRRWFAAVVAVAAVCVWAVAGIVVGLAAGVLCTTGGVLVGSELRRRREHRELVAMVAAMHGLAREVRSGATPEAAVLATAAAAGGSAGRVLEALAVGVGSHGGSAEPAGGRPGLAAEVTVRLTRGWAMSARYGVPWAALIDTVAADLGDRLTAASERNAQVAGPRVSGYVLAGMPVLGVVLGIGMGADPAHVLLATGPGHLMLLVGTSLTCLGLAWTSRIVRG